MPEQENQQLSAPVEPGSDASLGSSDSTGWTLDAPLAVIAGSVWAVLGLVRGGGPLDFVALLVGASLTQWLLLFASGQLRADERLRTSATVMLAPSLLVCGSTAFFVLRLTHHRPLGAVVAAGVSTAALAIIFAVSHRISKRWTAPPWGALIVGIVLWGAVAVGVVSAVADPNPSLLELATGLGLHVGALVLNRVVPGMKRLHAWSKPCWGGLWAFALVLFFVPQLTQGASRVAPLVLGLVGLAR